MCDSLFSESQPRITEIPEQMMSSICWVQITIYSGSSQSPSTKCGQSGSEGLRLAFFCGYGSTQHSSCQYLRTTWALGALRKQSLAVSMHITVVTCGRSSVSAGHTVSQTTHSIDVLIPVPLVPTTHWTSAAQLSRHQCPVHSRPSRVEGSRTGAGMTGIN